MVTAAPPVCLELRHLSKYFQERRVLADINLTVAEGEVVGIIGPNGAGKTTLVNIVTGQVRPTAGSVFFFGEETTRWPPHQLCHAGISRTFQIPLPFPEMTVLENVLLGCRFGKKEALSPAEERDRALELLELVWLAPKESAPARELTISELHRLEVARALATRPRLLLLDEVAEGLSPRAVEQVVGLLEKLRAGGLTLMLIDHRLHLTLKVSDRLVALDQGEKIMEGRPLEVIRHPEVVAAYLGTRPERIAEEVIS